MTARDVMAAETPGRRRGAAGHRRRGAAGKLDVMWTSGHGTGDARRPAGSTAVPPVQSFLFGHSRAEVVYDCR
ncbi:hypothetical protein [Actinomadura hallensis]|uniref:hypothetical protein n=1 Tax=Actinomadura hallensis TaxID=337895 RepID=UPI00114DE9C6|nr:hypothetical protein [Actinomadura hallensis]